MWKENLSHDNVTFILCTHTHMKVNTKLCHFMISLTCVDQILFDSLIIMDCLCTFKKNIFHEFVGKTIVFPFGACVMLYVIIFNY